MPARVREFPRMGLRTGCRRFVAAHAVGIVLALILCGGCAATGPPQTAVAEVALGEVSDEAYVLLFDLVLHNPNDVPLQLQEIVYVLSVDGRRVYTGRRSAEATVKASGEKHLRVPAVVSKTRRGEPQSAAAINYAIRGRVWYRTPETFAEALFDAKLHRPSVGFAMEGRLTFTGEPAGIETTDERR